MSSGLKLIIAGGGTGGHIFPAIAIANAFKKIKKDTEILFVGANGRMEMEKVPAAGFRIEGLDIAGFNRSSLISNIGLPFKLIKSFFQVKQIFSRFKPDAVIGVGGYSSFPVLRFAQQKGIPSFIHESNSYAGKSNMMLGKKATAIFVGTDGMEKFFPQHKLMITGNPVRESIEELSVTRDAAFETFGLDTTKKTVLSIGGSLGAKSINDAIALSLETFAAEDLQLIWQTGKSYAKKAKEISKGLENVWTSEFITEMDKAYAAADIVVSRSGAMSVSELCIAGKPGILVPYPLAAEDHQTVNAMHLVENNAAILVKDELAKDELMYEIVALMKDENKRNEMKTNALKLAKHHAAETIAKKIIEHLEGK